MCDCLLWTYFYLIAEMAQKFLALFPSHRLYVDFDEERVGLHFGRHFPAHRAVTLSPTSVWRRYLSLALNKHARGGGFQETTKRTFRPNASAKESNGKKDNFYFAVY
jgi:hypothetical protein